MRLQGTQLDFRPARRSEIVVSQAMLVYEDTDAGLRAKLALQYLPAELRLADDFDITFWRQDLLSLPWLREQAALEACGADVILISIDKEREAPGEVKDWLNRWSHHKGTRLCALGFLENERSHREGETPTIAYIRCIAEAAKAIFFRSIESSVGSRFSAQDGIDGLQSFGHYFGILGARGRVLLT